MAKPKPPVSDRRARLLAELNREPDRAPRCPICKDDVVAQVWAELREIQNGMPARRSWRRIWAVFKAEAGLEHLSINSVQNHAINHDTLWRHK